jgi:hypothetical protein
MKIVVFDLDETLGYFVEMAIFWNCLQLFLEKEKLDFFEIFELYPEFLRPNILNILEYIKEKKKVGHCYKLFIYTNNQGSKVWIQQIIDYFEKKLEYKLFDRILCAFKIHGKRVETCRTTPQKTYTDFIRCTKITKNTKICFLDDHYYPNMKNENVYYIYVKPYYHDLPFHVMIQRYIDSQREKKTIPDETPFYENMKNQMKMYPFTLVEKSQKDYNFDLILGEEILEHLHHFFCDIHFFRGKRFDCGTRKKRQLYKHRKTMKNCCKNVL